MSTAIRRPHLVTTTVGLLVATVLSACGSGSAGSAPAATTAAAAPAASSPATSSPARISGNLTVLAAASLTETFRTLAAAFEAANPGVHVTFSFGASSTLAQQIVAKAPADVFAAASPATMKTVTDAGDAAGTSRVFVRNTLEIAVPPDNPGQVNGLADLAKSGLKLGVCALAVPCGAAAQKVFQAANITPNVASYEQDVKGVLTKVAAGELDAGLVYRTDVKSAGDKVKGIEFPEAAAAINDYPIVALTTAANPAAAAAWVEFVTGPQARQILQDAGFQLP